MIFGFWFVTPAIWRGVGPPERERALLIRRLQRSFAGDRTHLGLLRDGVAVAVLLGAEQCSCHQHLSRIRRSFRVLSRRFTYPNLTFPQVSEIFAVGSIPGSSTKHAGRTPF
jgi:hypothetical protein